MNLRNPWDMEKEITHMVAFRSERDWEQFHKPKELATAISIEASELQELFLWQETMNASDIQSNTKLLKSIREEIADIAIYLFYLSHDLEIDLSQAIQHKLSINEKKYPVSKNKGTIERG